MRIVLSIFVAALVACGGAEPPPAPTALSASIRGIAQGEVVGSAGHFGGHVWRGIPFAASTAGDNRWRPPQPPSNWQGTRQTLENGSICPQFASFGGGPDGEEAGLPFGSEDCLVANVFAPAFEPSEIPQADARLPVMVWIHGGGNTIGDVRPYDGGRLATQHDVIVVTVQYRLGVFGWFSHPALFGDEDDALARSGNWGTLDLIRALAWVRENVAAFGGNPDNITIFGESAGGSNVYSLLASPAARGSFHRAISQSGAFRTIPRSEAENLSDASEPGHEKSSAEVLLSLLIADGAVDRSTAKSEAEAMTAAEIASYLRSKNQTEILEVLAGSGFGAMYSTPRLIRDGAVLPADDPEVVFARKGGMAPVPTILGTNRDENKLFLLFGSEHVRRVFGFPISIKDERAYNLDAEYQSKLWKASGVDEPAAAISGVAGSRVYAYRFDWDEEPKVLWANLSKMLGAAHAIEIPFVFGTFDLGDANRFLWDDDKLAGRDSLSDAMMSYWAQFAYEGDPGRGRSGALPSWAAWDRSTERAAKFIVLDTAEGGGLRMSSDTVSSDQLIAAIATDERFENTRARCSLYYGITKFGDRLDEDEYATVGGGICRDLPIESYPWDD